MESWIICLEECLPDFGINLERDKLAELAKVLYENSQCISDMEYEMRGGRSYSEPVDYEKLYRAEKHKVEVLERENKTYLDSVCARHKVEPNQVRLEQGSVMIYK